ncbi:putative T7SS-secreted protein [Cellulomonas phragmiteti]|uniref:putative T7SS-secreted protein n=1 Tax=Cellulomonas phragmiteti TaxID=478780 RepID=UPI0036336552
MTRPYSWYPLASSDPVPGDPAAVRAGGEHYRQVAAAIGDAERVLRTLVEAQDAVSQAVDAIRDRTHAVADRILSARQRYDAAGDALVGYAVQLDLAQSESLDALRTAQTAQRTLDVADDAVRRWTTLLHHAEDGDEDTTTQRRALTAARQERADCEDALAQARLRLDEAIDRRDNAARVAIHGFDTGTDDGLDDGWWEDWGADVAQVVSTWGGRIATGAGLLSLFLGWVPVLGQILIATSLIAGAAALAADIALAVKRGDGQDWFNVAMGVLGLVSFGASRLLGSMVKSFEVSARSASAHAVRQVPRGALGRLWTRLTPGIETFAARAAGDVQAFARGGGRMDRLVAAAQDVQSVNGWDRVLALSGHGGLVRQNNLLRTQLWEAFPFRPRAFLTLLGPTTKGAILEGVATVQYVGDATLVLTSAARTTAELATAPVPEAAARLDL